MVNLVEGTSELNLQWNSYYTLQFLNLFSTFSKICISLKTHINAFYCLVSLFWVNKYQDNIFSKKSDYLFSSVYRIVRDPFVFLKKIPNCDIAQSLIFLLTQIGQSMVVLVGERSLLKFDLFSLFERKFIFVK